MKIMGIFDRFLHRIVAHRKAETEAESDGEVNAFSDLNIREAVEAHILWRKEFENTVQNRHVEDDERAIIAASDQCELGKWIEGKAERFGAFPEYDKLRQAHAEFHHMAEKILAIPHHELDESMMNQIKDDFRFHSDLIQIALIRLMTRAKDPENAQPPID